jgi:V/A-type H+-transporting ATPase subunit D
MKIKFTQNELKKQRDALRQYERYLPTLQLKKQQLQQEIVHQQGILSGKSATCREMEKAAATWSGLLTEVPEIGQWLVPGRLVTARKNIAGVDIPVFEHLEFDPVEYDLFLAPFWLDEGLSLLRDIISCREEILVMEAGIATLRQELRITTQRVNLFEKVKIPGAREAIRLIKIALGDQMTNAVGRSKIAKNKIEEADTRGIGA